jgi:hypothetical protein
MFAVLRDAVAQAVLVSDRRRLCKLLYLAKLALIREEYEQILAIVERGEDHWRREHTAAWN